MKKLLSLLSAVAAMALVSCASATAPVTNPIFAGTVLPQASASVDIGSTSLLFQNLYLFNNAFVGSNFYLGNSSTGLRAFPDLATIIGAIEFNNQSNNGFEFIGGTSYFGGTIIPNAANSGFTLGEATTNSWLAIYLQTGAFQGVEFDNGGALFSTGTGSSAVTTLKAGALGALDINGEGGGTKLFGTGVSSNGVPYLDSSNIINTVSPSTSGFVLTSNGPTAAPSFQAGGGGGGGISGATSGQVIVATGATTGTSYSGLTSDSSGNLHSNSIFLPVGNISPAGGNMVASGTWVFNSVVAPAGGILGEFSGGSAASGNIGEYMTAEVVDSTVSLTTATQTNVFGSGVAALTLPAGDWDVGGSIYLVTSGATLTQITGTISTISASSSPTVGTIAIPFNLTGASNHMKFTLPTQRFSSNTSQAVYLNCAGLFSVGSMTAGGTVWARRSANAR